VGRLFRGDRDRVLFLRKSVQDTARDEPASFELVIVCDVLHHVALLEREQFLAAIDHAMAPGGSLAFKDWAPSSRIFFASGTHERG
jgi:2-polyprenyl-6-hydroxyphenyl methylase/3-demethylubiquinone-9 3-methyltransferase